MRTVAAPCLRSTFRLKRGLQKHLMKIARIQDSEL